MPRLRDGIMTSSHPPYPPSLADRVYARDFGKIKPKRIEPGVIGRAAWFAARAGRNEAALSLSRWLRALAHVERFPSADTVRARAADTVRELISASELRTGPDLTEPVLLDVRGEQSQFVVNGARYEGRPSFDALVMIKALDGAQGALIVPVGPQDAASFDMEEAFVADVTDPARPRIIDTFTYWPERGLLVGLIDRAGTYRVSALPKDPAVRVALELLGRAFQISRRNARLDEVDSSERLTGLSHASALAVEGRLSRRWSGEQGAGKLQERERVERSLRELVGPLLRDREVVAWPSILKRLRLRPRCSRWTSIGPTPGVGFGGIGRVTQLAIHPTRGDILIAAAAGGGVWRTENRGDTWSPRMSLEPTLTMGAVAIAPSRPSVMYAASGEDGGGWNPAWSGVGVYRSSDGGANWSLAASVPSTRFSALVVHPRDPNIVYAAGDRGLHKSVDGGASWLLNPGLSSLFDGPITDVVIAHNDPDRVYIGVQSDGVYRSTTGGVATNTIPAFDRLDAREQLPSGSDAGWIKLAIGRAGTHGSKFVAAKMGPQGSQIFTTTDAGDSWAELASGVASVDYDEWCSLLAVDPTDERVLYAGGAGALKRTTTGGAAATDWTAINTGIHADQQDLVFDPRNPQRIFLANDGGVYRSEDRGTTWIFASGQLTITQFYDIDIAERDRDIVAGGAQDNGVYYRNASGVWTHIPWGDGTQVAVDPTDPKIFYFSSQNGLPNYLRRSIDGAVSHQPLGAAGLSGGSPWVTLLKLDPTDPIDDPANKRRLFVCGHNTLFRSTNGGATWQIVAEAGTPWTTSGTITALEFAPSAPDVLYLGTATGALYRAGNGGAAAGDWTRVDTPGSSSDALFPNASIQALGVNPDDPDDVWVVFGGSGVSATNRPDVILNPLGISHLFRSRDGGATFTDVSGGFASMCLPDVPTSAVALSDDDPDVAFVGTDVGVFRTVDGGTTWTAFQDGLPRSPVTELRVNGRYNRLFAATMGRGVWVRDL